MGESMTYYVSQRKKYERFVETYIIEPYLRSSMRELSFPITDYLMHEEFPRQKINMLYAQDTASGYALIDEITTTGIPLVHVNEDAINTFLLEHGIIEYTDWADEV
jgi:hypothetical protein